MSISGRALPAIDDRPLLQTRTQTPGAPSRTRLHPATMAFCTKSASLTATSFAGVSVPRSGAFSAARAAPRSFVVRAQQVRGSETPHSICVGLRLLLKCKLLCMSKISCAALLVARFEWVTTPLFRTRELKKLSFSCVGWRADT